VIGERGGPSEPGDLLLLKKFVELKSRRGLLYGPLNEHNRTEGWYPLMVEIQLYY